MNYEARARAANASATTLYLAEEHDTTARMLVLARARIAAGTAKHSDEEFVQNAPKRLALYAADLETRLQDLE